MPDQNKSINIHISSGTILKAILLVIGAFLIYTLRDIVLVIMTSIVIASFVEIFLKKIGRLNFNRTFSVFVIYLTSGLILSGLFYVFVPAFLDEASGVITLLAKNFPSLDFLTNLQNGSLSGATNIFNEISSNQPIQNLIMSTKGFIGSLSGGFFQTSSLIFGGISNFILILIISFYLSIKEKGIETFLGIIVPITHEDYVINLWQRTEKKIALWVQGQMLLGVLIGVLIYLGLSILGVKYALVIALLSAILELIPFGLLLAVFPALIFAYLDGGVTLSLMVAGLYLVVQQFENYLIQPLIVKKVVGVSPLVAILSLLIGFKLAGFWGLILGVPVAVLVLELMDDFEKHKIVVKNTKLGN